MGTVDATYAGLISIGSGVPPIETCIQLYMLWKKPSSDWLTRVTKLTISSIYMGIAKSSDIDLFRLNSFIFGCKDPIT